MAEFLLGPLGQTLEIGGREAFEDDHLRPVEQRGVGNHAGIVFRISASVGNDTASRSLAASSPWVYLQFT